MLPLAQIPGCTIDEFRTGLGWAIQAYYTGMDKKCVPNTVLMVTARTARIARKRFNTLAVMYLADDLGFDVKPILEIQPLTLRPCPNDQEPTDASPKALPRSR